MTFCGVCCGDSSVYLQSRLFLILICVGDGGVAAVGAGVFFMGVGHQFVLFFYYVWVFFGGIYTVGPYGRLLVLLS